MALSDKNKRLLLGAALLLTLGISGWLGMDGNENGVDIVETAKPAAARRTAAPARAEPALPVLAQVRGADAGEAQGEDIFKSHSWFVAPAHRPVKAAVAVPPPAPEPAAAPVPPPLPFTYVGSVQENGRTVVFLAKEQRLYTVHKGDVIDGQYRLEDVGKGRIEFIYLPLNAKQILAIRGAS